MESSFSIRAALRKYMPTTLQRALDPMLWRLRVLAAVISDGHRYARHAVRGERPVTPSHLRTLVVKDGHRIEKGLALPSPREGFGRHVVARLLTNLRDLVESTANLDVAFPALEALDEYLASGHGGADRAAFEAELALLRARLPGSDHPRGGTMQIITPRASVGAPFWEFARARHSVRRFTEEPVGEKTLVDAIQLAQTAPSVCNRQPARVHLLRNDPMRWALSLQNGNAGFGDTAAAVLLVTVDLRQMDGAAERYQGWIDGGMFAMNLAYALHAQGLGTCFLNWSVLPSQDRDLRHELSLPDHEVVVVMIAVGETDDIVTVARSDRRPVNEIVTVHR